MEFKTDDNRFYQVDKHGYLIAEISFTEEKGVIFIESTFVDPDYRGQKIAEQLVVKVIDKAEKEYKKIHPVCSYAVEFFKKHREYQYLLQ